MTTDEEASPFIPGYETVTLPTETAFRVLESMRLRLMMSEKSFGQPPSPSLAEHCARLDEQIKEAGW